MFESEKDFEEGYEEDEEVESMKNIWLKEKEVETSTLSMSEKSGETGRSFDNFFETHAEVCINLSYIVVPIELQFPVTFIIY